VIIIEHVNEIILTALWLHIAGHWCG